MSSLHSLLFDVNEGALSEVVGWLQVAEDKCKSVQVHFYTLACCCYKNPGPQDWAWV